MPRMPEGYTEKRRDEILDACDELYTRTSFHDVTIKDISLHTSFSRPSIYNYFQNIEEIFLGLLQREQECWTDDLKKILQHDSLTHEELASEIAHTLEPRQTMLRIQATNLHEIEDSSRLERLIEFKRSFREATDTLDEILRKFVPEMADGERMYFMFSFMPFLLGVYPYLKPTEKQCRAMEAIGLENPHYSTYDLVRHCLIKLLG
jgi:AcrR family transcriptional regulator